jgi:hypothetical protein
MGYLIAVNAGALPEARVAGNDDLERLAKLVKNDDGTQGRALAGSALLAGAAVLAALALVALAMGARIG